METLYVYGACILGLAIELRCKLFGHRWLPAPISAEMGCFVYCERCRELTETTDDK
ncbi:MAG: DUF1660 family phage protein [Pseudomonadota bacterium]